MLHHRARCTRRRRAREAEAAVSIDAGSFLGQSDNAFAQGLTRNRAFRPARDKIHCFDLFRVPDELSVEFIRENWGFELPVGESTRPIFDRQVAPVRNLIELHEGDFHHATWGREPIEILMVDLAKSVSLNTRVLEIFFTNLVPGCSIVIQQDYHHPWLSHLHVVMEYLADHFELVAPRVDSSAAFLHTKAFGADALARAISDDFSHAEQIELLGRAIARLPEGDRHYLELVRVLLHGKVMDPLDLRREMDEVEQKCGQYAKESMWREQRDTVRSWVDTGEATMQLGRGNFGRVLELADAIIARGGRSVYVVGVRDAALRGVGKLAPARPTESATRQTGASAEE